jgi:hypothetical protein
MVDSSASPSDTYTVVGLLLSLAGLLATFFSVQLSQWLMNLLATNSKWEAYKNGRDDEAKAARRECFAELRASHNFVPLATTIIIGLFVFFIIRGSFSALGTISNSALKEILQNALLAFVWCYGFLAGALITAGYILGFRLSAKTKQ